MTDIPSDKPTDLDDILARYAVRQEQAVALIGVNKTLLFAALTTAGVTQVDIRFDGYGDSGQIEEIEARAGEDAVGLPPTQIEMLRLDYLSTEPVSELESLEDAIRSFCYALLEAGHGGWEINEGSFGDFRFDIPAGTITLAYNQRIETSEYSEHVY